MGRAYASIQMALRTSAEFWVCLRTTTLRPAFPRWPTYRLRVYFPTLTQVGDPHTSPRWIPLATLLGAQVHRRLYARYLRRCAVSGTTLWTAGATNLPDFPFRPECTREFKPLTPNRRSPGAYLGAVTDFSPTQPPAGAPQIGCILDAADLEPAGLVVPDQLLTIFGTGLGPTAAAVASDYSTTTLGGVSVTFGSLPAPLLDVSANHINVAVPLVPEGPSGTVMQVTVNGVSSPPLQFPVVSANPSLFVIPGSFQSLFQEFVATALNADGSLNSPTNPAQPGSVITVFVNGLSMDPQVLSAPPQLYAGGGWSVTNVSQTNPFMLQVNLQVPSTFSEFRLPGTEYVRVRRIL